MKLGTFLILVTTVAALTNTQSSAAEEHTSPGQNEQAISNQQLAYAAPADRSFIAVQALASGRTFRADPNLFSAANTSNRTDAGLIEDWRNRVFTSLLGSHMDPRGPESRPAENENRSAEMRMVARIAMKETMKLALERLPEIDRLVKVLKFEVSTDMITRKDEDAEAADTPSIHRVFVRRPVVKDRFFMKTGLRIPIDSGKPGLLSETNAVYGSFSSFFNVRLDNRLDSTLGLRYALSEYARLQIERQVAHASDTAAGGGSTLNLVKLVCAF